MGCADISPISPKLDQEINNQNGKIEDIKSNQNGLMLELGKLRNQTDINSRDIGNLQQGLINQSNQNSGVQILQGEGPLVMVFALCCVAMILIYHYRTKAIKSEKITEILSDQIALYDDVNLDNNVLLSSMSCSLEKEMCQLMMKSQEKTGTMKGQKKLQTLNYKPRVPRTSL